MRYLGLDLGEKRLGLAISRTGIIANPYKVINHDHNYNYLKDEILKIVEEEKIDLIVLGFPKNMNNSIGFKGEEILKFKELLEENGLKVALEDERLSTSYATKSLIEQDISRKKRKNIVDMIAAQVILEDYLKRKDK